MTIKIKSFVDVSQKPTLYSHLLFAIALLLSPLSVAEEQPKEQAPIEQKEPVKEQAKEQVEAKDNAEKELEESKEVSDEPAIDENSSTNENEQVVVDDEIVDANTADAEIVDQSIDEKLLGEGTLQKFEQEFVELQDKVASLSRTAEDYGELYSRMNPVIEAKTEHLYQLISARDIDLRLLTQIENDETLLEILSLTQEIKNFYSLRQRVFNEATPEFRDLYTGTKLTGINEAKLEARYVQLQFLIIFKGTIQRVLEIPERLTIAPVDIFSNIVMIFVAIVVMRTWRKWAKTGLPEWRQKVMAVRPRTTAKMKIARAIWYFENTRKPIEWLIFITFILKSIDILQINILTEVLSTITLWICVTYFVYNFLSKMIERGKQNLLKGITKKQSASLKIAIWWAGWYKLCFELTDIFIANGTIFAWLETLFFIILLPVYIFFVQQWKEDCFTYIHNERDIPEFVTKHLVVKTGIRGFINANLALAFLIYFLLTKQFLSLVSKVESGRRLTAEIYRKKLLNDNNDLLERSKALASLPEEVNDIFINGNGSFTSSVFNEPVDKVLAMAALKERSHVAVIGERGIGKSRFLKQVSDQYKNSLTIACTEDFDDIIKSVKEQLGIESENTKTSEIVKAIKEQEIDLILLDNCHRLLSPETSGQREIRRLYGWINELKGMALWVLTFDVSSWKLVNALGIAAGFFAKEIQLRKWTEEQIVELFEERFKQAELTIDFSKLVIPRQLADMEDDTVEGRNKTGIYRIIWGYADGNPAVACRTLAESIIKDEDGFVAKLPASPDNKIIESFEINTLLVLRVICQFGRCSTNDIVKNLRLHGLVVNSSLAACVAQGILVQVGGRYQISWLWFRSVSKYLARQNLLTR